MRLGGLQISVLKINYISETKDPALTSRINIREKRLIKSRYRAFRNDQRRHYSYDFSSTNVDENSILETKLLKLFCFLTHFYPDHQTFASNIKGLAVAK
jgi:hypothetical protein